MVRKNWKYILVLVLMLTLVVTVKLLSPQPVDWRVSFQKTDKVAFGSRILFDRLPDIFPRQPIRTATRTAYERADSVKTLSNHLFISQSFEPGEEDVRTLLAWVGAGNHVFVAAERFGGKLADTLQLGTRYDLALFDDSFRINFVNPALRLPDGYTFTHVTEPRYFNRFDTLRSVVLGVDSLDRPNFIRTRLGKGYFYLHAVPLAFTNYHLLYRNNAEYAAKSLSYLPLRPVVWDEYYKPGREERRSPLRFFLRQESLRWALYLSLAALVLFVVFEAKRRQRVIPVIRPLANSTLEFTQTVGRLYYQHRDHKNLADKKITYLLEFIRSRFLLSTDGRNGEFYENLSRKTGVGQEEIIRLFDAIANVQRQTAIAETELLALNREMEGFYKKIN